ncbi:bifunctional 4-hydroxy-2-oxoglutarate aldolase/2-dehydro-3-deoxy-phosphogluconate aldolase [Marinoscillum furvescens]|uniref:2-dehydro-3-deoxyphosphogluconate aldolase/(4S)-4-hydroxy-2-oxoglutarate aldolase n=1 Tax=Marinoscillum furvescens DSM 4134 TaxID=1122208 RepID=A0A3D9L4A9_MARFU|nr:bifunctional 4-hydroxy-2-oxoglutarate aldolase/2-dehydro-3-deoxy-phosphogluconate aldolase [Marinoscillum furvescens]REE00195.1 2-dehydro-3-deoxyphosphogluconate aldolase/(4S)-4-hydroxy-2-oxoglutarate aldolase [Marinoscillum furvescens DSM 4134]
MTRKEKLDIILKEKMVAIVRVADQNNAARTLGHLIDAGVKVLEITSNTPGYLEEIRRISGAHTEVLVGAGTVTNVQTAQASLDAGAQFLVSPNVNMEVIKIAHKHDVPVLMGALTPTEVSEAHENGADIIKLFPANSMGIGYFKAIKAPLDHVKFFVVGGINLENTDDWMQAGAHGIGVGSVLTGDKGNYSISDTTAIARSFTSILKKY